MGGCNVKCKSVWEGAMYIDKKIVSGQVGFLKSESLCAQDKVLDGFNEIFGKEGPARKQHCLKGQCHEIFDPSFFAQNTLLGLL